MTVTNWCYIIIAVVHFIAVAHFIAYTSFFCGLIEERVKALNQQVTTQHCIFEKAQLYQSAVVAAWVN